MKRILALIIILIYTASAQAVTFDTKTTGQKGGSGTTLTVSHTVTTGGANRAIFVLCGVDDDVITLTATYAGASMTEVRNDAHASVGTRTYIFKKLNPATGPNNWVVTQSVADGMICWAASATDVEQVTGVTDHTGSCPTGATSVSNTVTTAAGELILDIAGLGTAASTGITQGADQIQEMLLEQGTAYEATGSRQAGADGGVMSHSWTGSNELCHSVVSVKSAAVETSGGHLKRRASGR